MTPLYEILSGAKPKYDGRNQNTSSFWWGRDMTDGEGRPRNFLESKMAYDGGVSYGYSHLSKLTEL